RRAIGVGLALDFAESIVAARAGQILGARCARDLAAGFGDLGRLPPTVIEEQCGVDVGLAAQAPSRLDRRHTLQIIARRTYRKRLVAVLVVAEIFPRAVARIGRPHAAGIVVLVLLLVAELVDL